MLWCYDNISLAIERYIESAKRKARLRQSTRSRNKETGKAGKAKIKEPSDGQLMVVSSYQKVVV